VQGYDSAWGSEIIALYILNLVGVMLWYSCPGLFASWGKIPSYALDRSQCGPKTGLSAVDKRKISATSRNRTTIPQSSSPQPGHYTDWRTWSPWLSKMY